MNRIASRAERERQVESKNSFRDTMLGLLVLGVLFWVVFTTASAFLRSLFYENMLAMAAACAVPLLIGVCLYQLYLWFKFEAVQRDARTPPVLITVVVVIISSLSFYTGVLSTPWSEDDGNVRAWEIINSNVTQTYVQVWILAALVLMNVWWMYELRRTDKNRLKLVDKYSQTIRRLHGQKVENEAMIERREALIERIEERDQLRRDHLYIDEGVLDDYGFKLGLKDLFSSTLILGATGSGKTSASGMLISRYLLNQKMGGLILTYKTGEAEDWKQRLKAVGYDEDDIIIFAHEEGSECDFLRYEMYRRSANPGDVTNLVEILKTVGRLASGGDAVAKPSGGEDSYWEEAALSLIRNIIIFLKIAMDVVRLDLIASIAEQTEFGPFHLYDERQRRESVLRAFYLVMQFADEEKKHPIKNGLGRELSSSEIRDFKRAWQEIGYTFPSLNDRTRSSVLKRASVMFEPLLTGKMADMFASGKVSVYPEDTFEGKIIILDLSLQAYGMLGRVAQGVWKYLFQKAVERRSEDDERPVFLWVDEAHYFLNELDQRFLTTVRSKKCVTVFLTQNISNFITMIGDEPTKAMLGNFKTQIFHRNDSFDTNEYSADLIGKYWHHQRNEGTSESSSESSSTSHGENRSIGTSLSQGISSSDSKTTGRSGGVIGHLFMPPEVTNYYSRRASLSLATSLSESTTTGTSETSGTSTSHSESYSSSKSTSSSFTEIREYLVQPDELKRLNDNYGDIEGFVYFAGKDLGNNQPYKRALFDPLDIEPQKRFAKVVTQLEEQGVKVAKDEDHVEQLEVDNAKLETDLSKEWKRLSRIPKEYYETADFGGYDAARRLTSENEDTPSALLVAELDAEDEPLVASEPKISDAEERSLEKAQAEPERELKEKLRQESEQQKRKGSW